jgi:hypothetical protein
MALILPGRKTGRRGPRSLDQTIPSWSSLRLGTYGAPYIPTHPANLNWRQKMPAFLGMMLNGPTDGQPNDPILGDCTCAAPAHIEQVWTFNATGTMFTPSDEAVEIDYEQLCGYVPGDPSTDLGGNLQTVLKGWMGPGLSGGPNGKPRKIIGFIEVDPRHPEDVRQAIAETGALYGAGDLPNAWMSAQPGDTWGLAGQGTDGHCVAFCGYDLATVIATSWGYEFPVPDEALTEYFDELYAPVSYDWALKTGRTPFGMGMSDLLPALQGIALAA